MKKPAFLLTILLSFLNISLTFAQGASSVSVKDFQLLLGDWKGTLTYLDYSSNTPYTMPADVQIRQVGKSNVFIFSNLYPNEPKANSADTVTLSKNGRLLNKESVTSKRKLSNSNTEIVTEFLSKDGNENKPAIIRHTYLISTNGYKNIKEVKFVGQSEWLKRHEYSYTRK